MILTLWHITAQTHVPLKKLLSHTVTKDELTVFLSKELMEFSKVNKLYTVEWQNKAEASHRDGILTISAEVTQKRILHAIDATEWTYFSLDTDVFVLCLRRYPEFQHETSFVTGIGNRRRKIQLRPIY